MGRLFHVASVGFLIPFSDVFALLMLDKIPG